MRHTNVLLYSTLVSLSAEPYVTKALLLKLFGAELTSEVAARYFIEGQGPGGFRFRPECARVKR
jgi:hypothetical protein